MITVIMPTPVLNASLGAAPLPVSLDGDLHPFNLELGCPTGNIYNPVLEVCANTGAGISCMHLSNPVHLCLAHLDAVKQTFHCFDRAFSPIMLPGIVSEDDHQITTTDLYIVIQLKTAYYTIDGSTHCHDNGLHKIS